VPAAEYLATFEEFTGLTAAAEFFRREKVIVDTIYFASARLAGGRGDTQSQAVRETSDKAAQDRGFANAGRA
jgi:hypothetical protein